MLLVCGFAALAAAQSGTEGPDHPLVSRYAGSTMYRFLKQDYGEFALATARPVWANDHLTNVRTVEGKLFHAIYFGPAGKSPLEILRNFQQALGTAGFRTLYECANQTCGDLFNNLYSPRYNAKVLEGSSALASTFTTTGGKETRYLAAQLSRSDATVWVSLEVGMVDPTWSDTLKASGNQAFYGLAVVEGAAMSTGNVTVDASAMATALRDTGRVALYNLYFDTNSATLKPESDAALAEIQKLLAGNPQKKLLVVGHTDNVGTVDYNLDLSKRRAAAVVTALTGRYGVDAERLSPYGVANLSPVASNAAEEGRAKNRRVELVER
jgi:outer membrane protein OmpA-like peptidoglycan-associated protein